MVMSQEPRKEEQQGERSATGWGGLRKRDQGRLERGGHGSAPAGKGRKAVCHIKEVVTGRLPAWALEPHCRDWLPSSSTQQMRG